MSWVKQTFTSTIGRKLLVALSGLFLIIFLSGHVTGNLLLFKNDGGQAFNEYAEFMTSNQLVFILRVLTFGSILIHVIWSISLTIYNRSSRPVQYAVTNPSANSSWASRNMSVLGTIILIFIVMHLNNFLYEMKFGDVPYVSYESTGEVKDLYALVNSTFTIWWYSALYVVAMVFLGIHLAHGFQSAFQTLGVRHPKYTPFIQKLGLGFAVVVPALFASMPIYIFIKNLG